MDSSYGAITTMDNNDCAKELMTSQIGSEGLPRQKARSNSSTELSRTATNSEKAVSTTSPASAELPSQSVEDSGVNTTPLMRGSSADVLPVRHLRECADSQANKCEPFTTDDWTVLERDVSSEVAHDAASFLNLCTLPLPVSPEGLEGPIRVPCGAPSPYASILPLPYHTDEQLPSSRSPQATQCLTRFQFPRPPPRHDQLIGLADTDVTANCPRSTVSGPAAGLATYSVASSEQLSVVGSVTPRCVEPQALHESSLWALSEATVQNFHYGHRPMVRTNARQQLCDYDSYRHASAVQFQSPVSAAGGAETQLPALFLEEQPYLQHFPAVPSPDLETSLVLHAPKISKGSNSSTCSGYSSQTPEDALPQAQADGHSHELSTRTSPVDSDDTETRDVESTPRASPVHAKRKRRHTDSEAVQREAIRRNQALATQLRRENAELRRDEKAMREKVQRARERVIMRLASAGGIPADMAEVLRPSPT